MEKFAQQYAVVFSGGGALGAWEVGAYKYITEFLGKPPRTVIGSSAGALNAAGVFANHDVEALEKLWDVPGRNVYTVRLVTFILALLPTILSVLVMKYLLKGKYESLFNTNPLKKKITSVLENIQSLDDTTIDFAITMTDIFKSEKHVRYWMDESRIKAKAPSVTQFERVKCKHDLVDSLMATSAIPLIFPPNVHRFFDGGVLNNNPLSVANQLNETIIFVLVPSMTHEKPISDYSGILNIISSLMDTYINLNFKEVVYTVKLKNTISSIPKTKVCIIRPTNNFKKLKVGLLCFGKKVDKVVADGYQAAKERTNAFDLNLEDTWF